MPSRRHSPNLIRPGVLPYCFCSLLLSCQLVLAESAGLPSPLDLQQALAVGTAEFQPALLGARARQEAALAEIQRAESNYALEAEINLEAARIDPAPSAFNQSANDSKASLNIRQPLYDFGYTGGRVEAAETAVAAEQLAYQQVLAEQQLAIARSFFAAILTDIKFAWDNEAMAMLYVRVDKARDRFALKQLSEVELLRAENDYLQLLTIRRNTEISQRISRAQLAEAINRPGELSADLVTPVVELKNLQLPDPEALIKLAMQSNLELRAQEKRVAAAQAALAAARMQSRPSLAAEIEVTDYARDLPSREDWRAALNLKIPLFENGLVKSDVAAMRALWLQQQASYQQSQSAVRQQVYAVWMQLNNLLTKATELETAALAADRALDKSRGEYDLELRTDYGDALVNTSRVRYQQAENTFELITAAMRLVMLTGQAPRSVIDQGSVKFQINSMSATDEN